MAVSAQTPDNSLTTAEKNELAFDVLSDVGGELARAFGLVFRLPNTLRPYYDRIGVSLGQYNGDDSWQLPIPATYVVGQDGIIRFAFLDPDYTRRLEPADLLKALSRVDGRA